MNSIPLATSTCPYCLNAACEADWAEAAHGYVQVAPFSCECGAVEIRHNDALELTAREHALGWYAPGRKASTQSTIAGESLDEETAMMLHVCGFAPGVPFHLATMPERLAHLL